MRCLLRSSITISSALSCPVIVHHFSLSSVVTIGFDATAYTFTETDSTVSRSVGVSVRSGSLDRDVVLTVETMDDTATGGALSHTQTLYMCHSCVIISPSSFI